MALIISQFGSDSQRVLLVHAISGGLNGWSKLCIIFKRGLLYFRFASQGLIATGFNIQQVLKHTSCLWPTRPYIAHISDEELYSLIWL